MFTRTLLRDVIFILRLSVTHRLIRSSPNWNVRVDHGPVFEFWQMLTCVVFVVFAPIALIQSYETVEEAIELANGTKYGLGASVFGPDETYAIQVAKLIKCGMVAINDFAVFYVSSFWDSPLISRTGTNLMV